MIGETHLNHLLAGLSPRLHPDPYVFCHTLYTLRVKVDGKGCLGVFREAEGQTLILSRAMAQSLGLPFGPPMAWITLDVHSSLEAVGLTAAVSTALAESGISCNVVAAFYHDHLFVPYEAGVPAQTILQGLAEVARSQS